MAEAIAVLEIGGTHIASAVLPISGRGRFHMQRTPIDPGCTRTEFLAALGSSGEQLNLEKSVRWVVAAPSPFDYQRGIARFHDVGKFDQLRGLNLREFLFKHVTPPPADIAFINDADAFALGQASLRPSRDERIICLTLGSGVGSGFVQNGEIVSHGPDVPLHGEIHRVAAHGIPLEETFSRRAIRREYATRTGKWLDVHEIAHAAINADPIAAAVFADSITTLGIALAPWIHRFGATSVVVGGSIATSWQLIGSGLTRAILEAEPAIDEANFSVEAAREPELAPFLGAVSWLRASTPSPPRSVATILKRTRRAWQRSRPLRSNLTDGSREQEIIRMEEEQ